LKDCRRQQGSGAMKPLVLFAMILTIQCSCAIAAEGDASGQFTKPQAVPPTKREVKISSKPFEPKRLTPKSNYILVSFSFDDWVDHNRYWEHPSNINVYNDGSTYIYAHHLANMLNDPYQYTFFVNLTFFTGDPDPVSNTCSGVVIYSTDVDLYALLFSQEAWDVSKSDTYVPVYYFDQTKCVTAEQWMRVK
jgi:hypothetical protein